MIDNGSKEISLWGSLHSILMYAQRASFSDNSYGNCLHLFVKFYQFLSH